MLQKVLSYHRSESADRLHAWARRNDKTLRRALLWLALAVLLAGLFFSLQEQRHALTTLDWRPIALVLLLPIPLVLLLSVLEYIAMGRLLGKRLAFGHALEVTIVGAAANMLPLPGSVLVRMAGLKLAGAGLGDGALLSLLVFLVWLGSAASYSGAWVAVLGSAWTGAALGIAGLATLLVAVSWARRFRNGDGLMTVIAVMRLGVVVLEALRIYLCFRALGFDASFAQSSGLTVTTVLGSIVSVVPAGLGIREIVAAAFSPVLGLAMSAGFLATVLNRLLAMFLVVPLAALLVVRSHGRLRALLPQRGQQPQG